MSVCTCTMNSLCDHHAPPAGTPEWEKNILTRRREHIERSRELRSEADSHAREAERLWKLVHPE